MENNDDDEDSGRETVRISQRRDLGSVSSVFLDFGNVWWFVCLVLCLVSCFSCFLCHVFMLLFVCDLCERLIEVSFSPACDVFCHRSFQQFQTSCLFNEPHKLWQETTESTMHNMHAYADGVSMPGQNPIWICGTKPPSRWQAEEMDETCDCLKLDLLRFAVWRSVRIETKEGFISNRVRVQLVRFPQSIKHLIEKPSQARFFPGPNPVAKGVQPEISILNHASFSPARDFWETSSWRDSSFDSGFLFQRPNDLK